MLGTRERTLLLESLRPPAGYRLRRAVGTSYTLDLIALLTAPLEGSVVEVQPPRPEGFFHPKLWVLAFEADEAPTIYRVLCLSRNLTFSRSQGYLKVVSDGTRL